MAGNGIESKLEDRGSHKREGKKERKKGWRREVRKGADDG